MPASAHLPTPLEEISEADFDRVFAVNVKSVYLTARHLVPHMKASRRGAILNIASTAGGQPAPAADLVQCHQGLDGHGDQVDGGGTGARSASASTPSTRSPARRRC